MVCSNEGRIIEETRQVYDHKSLVRVQRNERGIQVGVEIPHGTLYSLSYKM